MLAADNQGASLPLTRPFSGHALKLVHPKYPCAQSVTALPCCSAHSLLLAQKIARAIYSNPPLHGALLVSTILNDEKLKQQWYKVSAKTACCRYSWHLPCRAKDTSRAIAAVTAKCSCLLHARQ